MRKNGHPGFPTVGNRERPKITRLLSCRLSCRLSRSKGSVSDRSKSAPKPIRASDSNELNTRSACEKWRKISYAGVKSRRDERQKSISDWRKKLLKRSNLGRGQSSSEYRCQDALVASFL